MKMATMKGLVLAVFAAGTVLAHADADTPLRVPIDADGVQRATIVGGSYFFRPNHVIVRAHAPVELTVSAESGVVPHSFEIDAPQAGIAVRTELGTTPRTFPSMRRVDVDGSNSYTNVSPFTPHSSPTAEKNLPSRTIP